LRPILQEIEVEAGIRLEHKRWAVKPAKYITTINGYVQRIDRYLRFAKIDRPTEKNALAYRESVLDRHPSRSTLNNDAFALMHFHGHKAN